MNAMTTLAASVQAKKGRLYAVIQVRENGQDKACVACAGTAGEQPTNQG